MNKVRVKKGSEFIITNGPSALGIEHSLFDEQVEQEARKHVRISVKDDDVAEKDYVLKFSSLLTPDRSFTMVIVAAFRTNPYDPICKEWVLWGLNGGVKAIMYYSTATRLGSGRYVDEFPEY